MKIHTVIVDDLREPVAPRPYIVLFKTADAAIEHIRGASAVEIRNLCLDHDLGLDAGGEPCTIFKFINFLEEVVFNGMTLKIDVVWIHTANPKGAANIRAAFDNNILRKCRNVVRICSDTSIGLRNP